ncbi:MAG: BolA family protein [Fidelibacterota bacterium]
MNIHNEIEIKLNQCFDIKHLELIDDTGKHLHHKSSSGGAHYSAIIVSSNFSNLNLLERHRLVYSAINNLMKKEIHAFSMKTYSVEEWDTMKKSK